MLTADSNPSSSPLGRQEEIDAEGKPLPPTCEMCGQWMFRKEIQERYAAKLNRELNTEAANPTPVSVGGEDARECVYCGFKWFPKTDDEPCPHHDSFHFGEQKGETPCTCPEPNYFGGPDSDSSCTAHPELDGIGEQRGETPADPCQMTDEQYENYIYGPSQELSHLSHDRKFLLSLLPKLDAAERRALHLNRLQHKGLTVAGQIRAISDSIIATIASPISPAPTKKECPHHNVVDIGECAQGCCDKYRCLDCGKIFYIDGGD
jgi:hypothetical protein